GVFAGWLREEGTAVRAGEPLFRLESDKATQDVDSLEAGILRLAPDGPREGQTVAVGTVIGYLVAAGEAVPEAPPQTAPAPVATGPGVSGNSTGHGPLRARPAISPRARRVARELGIDWMTVKGSGRTGRIRERDVRAAAAALVGAAREAPMTSLRRTIAER